MKNNIEFKLKEFLDNVVMMRMDDDLEVLGKRLGFAEKKKRRCVELRNGGSLLK